VLEFDDAVKQRQINTATPIAINFSENFASMSTTSTRAMVSLCTSFSFLSFPVALMTTLFTLYERLCFDSLAS
jgi:hypothetical protein